MKISNIRIENYRKFEDVVLDFSNQDIMILAGANNSGKTSVITLLHTIFNNKNHLKIIDIALNRQREYIDNLITALNNCTINNAEEFSEEYVKLINDTFDTINIKVQFKITYKNNQHIGLFANYLMDLDITKKNFFFEYQYTLNKNSYNKEINEYINDLYESFLQINRSNLDELSINSFMDLVFESVSDNLSNKYYYCDENFEFKNEMEFRHFEQLFNFKHISANRLLNDEDPNFNSITEQILSIDNPLKEGSWRDEFNTLHSDTRNTLEKSDVKEKFNKSTQDELKSIKEKIDVVKINDFEKIITDVNLEDEKMLNFIKSIFSVKYSYTTDVGELILSENSQGLGVSNLIYITLEINKFINNFSSNKVNLLVIEEPENHMHIQMQKIFIDFILDSIDTDLNPQYIITTHSTELIKTSPLKTIKVIRSEKPFNNFIVDFNSIIEERPVEERKYYETFFKLNFIQIIFADYAVFFEGDTERMYLENIINRKSEFKDLSKQYIAYCQVGGAYAHNYFYLVNILKIRTIIFTDLDYRKQKDDVLLDDLRSALDSDTTNYTLKTVINENNNIQGDITCEVILQNINNQDSSSNYYKVYTQGQPEGYGRTLEDTLLYSYITKNFDDLEIENVFADITRQSWEKIINSKSVDSEDQSETEDKDKVKLHLSVPNKTVASIRYVSDKIDKSNFMYSIISNDFADEIIPNYINEGLTWLMD